MNMLAASGYHFTTSFMSTEYILSVLCDYGYEDDAYRLVTQTTFPSLINMVGNQRRRYGYRKLERHGRHR